MLNDILKNEVVDAQTCIELFSDGYLPDVLEQARDLCFKSMWWSRLERLGRRRCPLSKDPI